MRKSLVHSLLVALVLAGSGSAGELDWLQLLNDDSVKQRASADVDALDVPHLGATLLEEFIVESQPRIEAWAMAFLSEEFAARPPTNSIFDAITASWLQTFQGCAQQLWLPSFTAEVQCDGVYRHHLQGICTNRVNAIYWCFTTTLVKTDPQGKVLKEVPVADHHGDLCYHKGKIYVAVNHGRFNDPEGNADSWVYVYDAQNLHYVTRHRTREVFYGAGGIACDGKRFIVVGGLPRGSKENLVYEYDRDFNFVEKYVIESGYTRLGIQTATFADRHWWFGCYGSRLLRTDSSLLMLTNHRFDAGLGCASVHGDQFLIGQDLRENGGHLGRVRPTRMNEKLGLTVE